MEQDREGDELLADRAPDQEPVLYVDQEVPEGDGRVLNRGADLIRGTRGGVEAEGHA